jgi:hypothetical protein
MAQMSVSMTRWPLRGRRTQDVADLLALENRIDRYKGAPRAGGAEARDDRLDAFVQKDAHTLTPVEPELDQPGGKAGDLGVQVLVAEGRCPGCQRGGVRIARGGGGDEFVEESRSVHGAGMNSSNRLAGKTTV